MTEKVLLGNGLIAGTYETLEEKYGVMLDFFQKYHLESVSVCFTNLGEKQGKATDISDVMYSLVLTEIRKIHRLYLRGVISQEEQWRSVREMKGDLITILFQNEEWKGKEEVYKKLAIESTLEEKTFFAYVNTWYKVNAEEV